MSNALENALKKKTELEHTSTISVIDIKKNTVSTGSSLLNLSLTNAVFGGFVKGKYYFLVGDSASGKTFLSMTCFAEACRNRHFKNYRLIYDDVEGGCLIDLAAMFGETTANRIEPPCRDADGTPLYSSTIEEFYYNVHNAVTSASPCIYILDSMDSLTSEAEENKFEESKEAHLKGKAVSGSYGDGKAKKNSSGIRQLLKHLRSSGSILIILSQTRDNISGFGFEKKTRSGGKALRFYAASEIWSSIVGSIKKTVKGKNRKIGIFTQLSIKKNRQTGKNHDVKIAIYPSYGIDDIGSCVDYLLEEGWWKTKKQSIEAIEFGVSLGRDKLIQHIEEHSKVKELRIIVETCWNDIEKACSLKRKKRYD